MLRYEKYSLKNLKRIFRQRFIFSSDRILFDFFHSCAESFLSELALVSKREDT